MTAQMNTWIDERSFEQITAQTTSTGRYDYIARLITQDQHVFRGSNTIYDLTISENQCKINQLTENLKMVEARIAKLKKEKLEGKEIKSKKPVQQKPKAKPMAKIDWRSSTTEPVDDDTDDVDYNTVSQGRTHYDELQSDELNLIEEIDSVKRLSALLDTHRKIISKEHISLNRAALDYKQTGDAETLRKAVHWICDYTQQLIARESPLPREYQLKPVPELHHDRSAW